MVHRYLQDKPSVRHLPENPDEDVDDVYDWRVEFRCSISGQGVPNKEAHNNDGYTFAGYTTREVTERGSDISVSTLYFRKKKSDTEED